MIDRLVARLSELGQTMATAESLTGGLVAATVVDVPGASKVLRGGLVVYATELKHTLAGVDAGLLAAEGPVSEAVARQLARNTRRACGADWGVATTGVAGPDPQDGHPVGTVFVAVSGPGGVEQVTRLSLGGDRPAIRAATVKAALGLLASLVG